MATLSHDCLMMYVCVGETRTWTVNEHPLCQSYYGCPNGTVTNHGSTGHEWREWQYVYNTRAVTVTVTYTDTLTEGGVGRRGSGSTCTVHVLQLLCLT